MTPDQAGMDDDTVARMKASDDNLAGIIAGRRRAARALLAPPGPAAQVRAGWEPVRQAVKDSRTPAANDDD